MVDALTKVSEPKSPTGERSARAVIGPCIQIMGERYGEEDVLTAGRAEGTIEVKNNSLTGGPKVSVRSGVGW